MTFTFAVVGHDEAPTLADVLVMALGAARDADEVWFVDSASTDGSRAIAESLDVTVVEAPLGKGRAMAAALERCRTSRILFLDADVRVAERDVARILRAAANHRGGMVVGQIDALPQPTLCERLTTVLFPEVPRLRSPLSGFRALDAGRDRGPLPGGYGIEAHLNIEATLAGEAITTVEIGGLLDAERPTGHIPRVAHDVAEAVLDLAAQHGRLTVAERPVWDAWVQDTIAGVHGGLLRPLPQHGSYGVSV